MALVQQGESRADVTAVVRGKGIIIKKVLDHDEEPDPGTPPGTVFLRRREP